MGDFRVTNLHDEWMRDLRKRFDDYKEKTGWINADGGIQIYTDYRDRELSTDFLKKIFNEDDPKSAFEERIHDYEWDYEAEYGWGSLVNDLMEECSEEEIKFWEENKEDVNELVREKFYWYYDIQDFNGTVKVNILVDTDNRNYDFCCDNILNYCGNGEIDEHSSILWLARQQGKEQELREAVTECYRDNKYYVDREVQKDKFIESCIQELENLSSQCATLTFLVEMPILDVFKCLAIQNRENDPAYEYEPSKNKKAKSYITLGKETMCGLFAPFDGGGSVLEIELDKDIQIPLKHCIFAVDGCKRFYYDVDEVYGLVGSCWKDTVKEIKEARN